MFWPGSGRSPALGPAGQGRPTDHQIARAIHGAPLLAPTGLRAPSPLGLQRLGGHWYWSRKLKLELGAFILKG